MAAFIMNCPYCGMALQVQDEWIGMETDCPSCRQRFIIQKFPPQQIPQMPQMPPMQSGYNPQMQQMPPMQPGYNPQMQQMPPMQSGYNPQMPPPNPNSLGCQPAQADTNDDSSGCLWLLASICWIVGFICCFVIPPVGLGLLVVAFLLSLIALLVKKKNGPFVQMPGENILSTFRISDFDDVYYYTRVTDHRLVLSAIEYPFLPAIIAGFVDLLARPTQITYAWAWNEIVRIELIREKEFLGYRNVMLIEDVAGGSYRFRKNGKLLDIWNNMTRG